MDQQIPRDVVDPQALASLYSAAVGFMRVSLQEGRSVVLLPERRSFVHRNVVGLAALDFVLRIVLSK